MLKFDWQVRLSVYHDLSRMYYLTKYLGQRAISIEKMCFLTQPHTIFIEQCFPAYSSYHLECNPRYLINIEVNDCRYPENNFNCWNVTTFGTYDDGYKISYLESWILQRAKSLFVIMINAHIIYFKGYVIAWISGKA